MKVFQLSDEYAVRVVAKIYLLSDERLTYVDPVFTSLTKRVKENFTNIVFQMGILGNGENILYAPILTPMVPIFEKFEAFMNNDDCQRIFALVPWLTITNGISRTKRIMEFGLRELWHLPRRSYPGTSVQTCFIIMDRDCAGQSARFDFME